MCLKKRWLDKNVQQYSPKWWLKKWWWIIPIKIESVKSVKTSPSRKKHCPRANPPIYRDPDWKMSSDKSTWNLRSKKNRPTTTVWWSFCRWTTWTENPPTRLGWSTKTQTQKGHFKKRYWGKHSLGSTNITMEFEPTWCWWYLLRERVGKNLKWSWRVSFKVSGPT